MDGEPSGEDSERQEEEGGEDSYEQHDGILAEASIHEIPFRDLTIGKIVGEGAYGIVMKGKYFGAKVAIKLLEQQGDEEEVNLYNAREVFNLQGMRHPNIVNMLGVSKNDDGKIYIVMEWMSKGNLFKFLQNSQNRISWRQRTQMARDAAHAIAYLHSQGLIHRDIKSENLVMGDGGRVKLADFGCSRVLPKLNRRQKRLTITGTRDWMAPEVLMALYDEKVDVFGFGIVLYELITRQMPPERMPDSPFDFEDEIIKSQIPLDCPPKLLRLAKECSHPRSDLRPDFEHINAKLNEIIHEFPTESKEQKARAGEALLLKKNKKMAKKKAEISKLKEHVQQMEENIFDERENVRKEVEEEFTEEVNRLKALLESAKEEKKNFQERIESCEETIFDLRANSGGEADKWEAKVKELQEQLQLTERQLEDQTEGIAVLEARIKELEKNCKELQQEKDDKEKEWRQNEEKLAKSEEEKKSLQDKIESCEEIIIDLRASSGGEAEKWEAKAKELQEQLQLTERQLEDQTEGIAVLEARIKELEKNCKELQQEKDDKEKEWKQNEENLTKSEEEQKQEAAKRLEAMKGEWDQQLLEEKEKVQRTTKQLEAKKEELNEWMSRVNKWEEKYRGLQEEHDKAKERLQQQQEESLHKKEQEKNASAKVIADIEDKSAKQIEALKKKAEEAQFEKEKLEAELEGKDMAIKDLKKQVADLNRERKKQKVQEKEKEKEKEKGKEREQERIPRLDEVRTGEKGEEKEMMRAEQGRQAELMQKLELLEKKEDQRKVKWLELQDRMAAKEEDNQRLRAGLTQLLAFTKNELILQHNGGGRGAGPSTSCWWLNLLMLVLLGFIFSLYSAEWIFGTPPQMLFNSQTPPSIYSYNY